MKKRLMCMCLSLTMIFSLSVPVVAADTENEGMDMTEEEIFITENFNRFTIQLPGKNAETDIAPATLNSDIAVSQHQENVAAARDFVYSLNLDESGHTETKESCLTLLNDLEKQENTTLTSFSVLVPKSTEETYTYYGTYATRDFYYKFFADYEEELEVNSTKGDSKLQQWFNALMDLSMCFMSAEITVPITLVKAAINAPSNYTIKSNAYTDYYFYIKARPREIYHETNDGRKIFGGYGERGSAQLFMIFHPVDSTTFSEKAIVIDEFNEYQVATKNFFDEDATMKDAYDYAVLGKITNPYRYLHDNEGSHKFVSP